MTLGYSLKWSSNMGDLAHKRTYFPNKICKGLWSSHSNEMNAFVNKGVDPPSFVFDPITLYETDNLIPKTTSIREDKCDRWKEGNLIHFVVKNRTKDRFQFAPVIKCVSVQHITIDTRRVIVDDYELKSYEIEHLAANDGFDSSSHFFRFFKSGFNGKIIHWTNLLY